MDILFGDPFYHNIIYHLQLKDLYNLICTCSHYKETIPPIMKNIIIKNVKNDLYSGNIKSLKNKLIQCKLSNEIMMNKYFIIVVYKVNFKKLNDDDNLDVGYGGGTRFYVDGMNYDIAYNYTAITQNFNNIILFIPINDNSDITKLRKKIYQKHKSGPTHFYWIENKGGFNITDYL